MYWWNATIADLRSEATTKAQRKWTRSRRREQAEEIERKRAEYRRAKKDLKREIAKAKNKAWKELILTIDDDPWGLPYKIVLNRLRRANPSLTETMEEEILDQVLDSLFPRGDQGNSAGTEWPNWRWDDIWEVLPGEVDRHVKKRPAANKAPGPDGLKATLWRKVSNVRKWES